MSVLNSYEYVTYEIRDVDKVGKVLAQGAEALDSIWRSDPPKMNVMHSCHPSIWVVEAEESEIQGHPGLHEIQSEKISVCYITFYG